MSHSSLFIGEAISSVILQGSDDPSLNSRTCIFRDSSGNTILEVTVFVTPSFYIQTKLPTVPSAPILCGTTRE